MKRKNLLLILVAALVLSAFFVACKADIEAPSGELVDVTFAMDGSRALSATLEDFDPDLYYWKYAAAKNAADTSGLNSGATEGYNGGSEAREAGALWIHEGVSGLSGTVPGFSQGLWDFTLYAYTKEGTSESPVYSLTYLGEAKAVSLVKSEPNKVHVVVSPAPEGNGKLYIGETTLNPKKPGDTPSVSRFLKVEDFDGQEYAPTSGTTYILPAGTYRVTVTYKASGITYADGMVIATVYPNMTTTVTGSVDELVTYAQFEAEQNPDIITRTAGVDGITSTTTGDEQGNINLSEPTTVEDKKISATVPAAAAVAMLPKVGENPDPNASMSLELNVDTKDSTSTSVTYEISMTKIVTLNSEVTTTDVDTLGTDPQTSKKYYAVATVQLSTGLTGVKVTHDGQLMVESESTGDDDGHGVFFYYASTGILKIQTNTFSPFQVTYDGQTAGVAEVNGVKYATLKEAVDAAPAGATVKLLSDAEGAGMSISKSITIDLNEHTYTGTKDPAGSTGTKSQLFQLLQESGSVTIKNGALSSEAGSGILMLVQNYCNLTLEDVTLDGSNIGEGQYTLSNNQGDISIKGEKTNIVAPKDGIAFDVCSGWSVYKSTKVTVSGGNINGAIEVTDCGSADKVELVIEGGFFAKAIERPEGYQTDNVSISIKGGTFAWNPTEYVASGYEVEYDSSTELWTVVKQKVAKIGETYYTSLKDALSAVKKGETITLLCDIELTEKAGSYYSNYYHYYLYSGRTLDGDGHTITLRMDANDQALFETLYGTIKNLTIDFGTIKGGCIAAESRPGARFENVIVKGTFTELSGNSGAFVRYVWGDISLEDCDSYVDMTGTGTNGDYDAVFLGYTNVSGGVTLEFTRCINYGTVSCGHVALFLGNPTYKTNSFIITESYNKGNLYGLYGAKDNNPFANIICAVTVDGSLASSSFSIDGETYSYNQIANGEANSVINKGIYVVGSETTTLSISVNPADDLTFVVTPIEGASYYTVGVGLYTSLKAGGSTRNFVYETIAISGDSAVTQVKDLAFVDDEWVAEHTEATSTVVVYGDNSYTVYTLGETSYYLINNTAKDTLHGDVRPATLISVSAFDVYDKLIAVASLSSN